eukprot:10251368-Lingulodinium_polyedra.AAC.1
MQRARTHHTHTKQWCARGARARRISLRFNGEPRCGRIVLRRFRNAARDAAKRAVRRFSAAK